MLEAGRPALATIGVFDGVHRGHQALIRELVDRARRLGLEAVVLTFFPHPDVVLRGLEGRYYLTTPDQRAALLGELGVDTVVTLTFDAALRTVRAADFVDTLLRHINLRELWVGPDFALGYQREGNVDFLRAEGARRGFDLHTIDLIVNGGAAIRSTAIREALLAGDVERARDWLGRPYAVAGQVVRGAQRGRTIGFPTANIAIWDQQAIPANGVYACWAEVGGARYMAATNIGVRPTFDGQTVTVEPHLLDFEREIYEQALTVHFEKRLRGEQRFDGIEALMRQISADVAATRAFLNGARG